jgi:AraC-like DNA-binding protein
MELDYVMEGRFHKQIEGKDYVFNKGEFLLINQGVSHSDYLYSRNMTVITLHISNEFLNKTMNHSEIALAGKEAEEFYNRFITKGRGEYHFVRFTPKEHSTPVLFEQIINELIEPGAGSSYIVMGYVDRLLSLIPLEYQVDVEWGGKKVAEKNLFEKILFLLEDCHEDVSLQDLVAAFGHNPDYFNRLIKRYRGMTYSEFLQNIRLEKAEQLLRSTEYPVEVIAGKVGYKNMSYFYKIFMEKFQMSPGEMRKIQQ